MAHADTIATPGYGRIRTLKERTRTRLDGLKREWDYNRQDWEDCSDFVLGARGKFLEDRTRQRLDNDRRNRNQQMYNETPKFAARTLAAGMMAGITSPARPWFKLSTGDQEMDENEEVREWLDSVVKRLLLIFARSNFYASIYSTYLELGTFGTACLGVYEDYEDVARYAPYTIGSYMLGMGENRRVDTMYRQYQMPIGAAVQRFGRENLSKAAQQLWLSSQDDSLIDIVHAIEPSDDRDWSERSTMGYRSVYFEWDCDNDEPLLLSGFKEQPFMAPRWEVIGEEAYAMTYPGIDSMGTNKSLQVEELDYAIAREKSHNPPLVGDSALQTQGVDLFPGGVSYVPNMAQTGRPGLVPVYAVQPRVAELVEAIRDKQDRLMRFFHADLFMMITQLDRAQITATEIAERREEKLLMLGPVLERLSQELLDPVIDRTFAIAQRAGILPPAPESLGGRELAVEYISILAQAQRAVSTAGMESTVAFAGALAEIGKVEALAKIDGMQAVDEFAQAKGVPPRFIRDDAAATEELQAQQAAEQRQAAMAAVPQVAGAANQAAQAAATAQEVEPDALQQMLGV